MADTLDDVTLERIEALGNFGFNLNREAILNRLRKTESQRDELLALIEETEWVHYANVIFCPSCKFRAYAGHAPDCPRQAIIAKVKGE